MKKLLLALTCAASTVLASASALADRDQIMIVGSSTVFPLSKVVSERFALKTGMKAPKVEPTGTGGGFKEFCKGVGVPFPDIANASRKIKASEFQTCQANGVKDVVEVLIGYDGIVLAQSLKGVPMSLTLKDLFLALAKKVPDPKGGDQLVDNPYKTWKDVNSALPPTPISVMGPPPTSGTRDAFAELVMDGGCNTFPALAAIKAADEARYKATCQGIREDGVYVEAGENDNLIVKKLAEKPESLGVFGFSYLDQNADAVRGLEIAGHKPTFEAISNGSYVVSRPLYFYVKKAHVGVIPGIDAFVAEFTSEKAWSDQGYLAEKGLIPLSAEDRKKSAANAKELKPMAM